MNLRVADRDDDGDARVGAVLARCPVRSGAEEVAAEFDESIKHIRGGKRPPLEPKARRPRIATNGPWGLNAP